MKDPRQRLSWPELLYHPFIAGRVTGKYGTFLSTISLQSCFCVCFNVCSPSKSGYWPASFFAVINDTTEQAVANPFTSKLSPELQALKDQQAHFLAPHSGQSKILKKARQKMAQEAQKKVKCIAYNPWEESFWVSVHNSKVTYVIFFSYYRWERNPSLLWKEK